MSEQSKLPIWPIGSGRFRPFHVEANQKRNTLGGSIYLLTTSIYLAKYFRHDKHIMKLGAFLFLNLIASYAYSSILIMPVMGDAIIKNNEREY